MGEQRQDRNEYAYYALKSRLMDSSSSVTSGSSCNLETPKNIHVI